MYGQQNSYGIAGSGIVTGAIGGTLAGSAMAQEAQQRQPEVQREMDGQEGALHALEATIEQLEKRLSESVLGPAAPNPSGEDKAAPAPNCGLGSRLKESNARILKVRERLADLMARLEV